VAGLGSRLEWRWVANWCTVEGQLAKARDIAVGASQFPHPLGNQTLQRVGC
jgi:hypothetical protein